MAKDILLDENGDLLIVNGDLVISDSLTQEVAILLQLNKGELKEDPVLGTDLMKRLHGNISKAELQQILKIQFARDNKDFNELKDEIQLRINETSQ